MFTKIIIWSLFLGFFVGKTALTKIGQASRKSVNKALDEFLKEQNKTK